MVFICVYSLKLLNQIFIMNDTIAPRKGITSDKKVDATPCEVL